MPSLGRERTALELEYREMSDQIKMEKSKLSDFELEELSFECMKKARLKKAQEDATDLKVQRQTPFKKCVRNRLMLF